MALRKVNLTIEDGEFVFITGNSGAGKSTMVHLLTCEDFPSKGDVIVDGVNTRHLSRRQIPKYRRRIGIVFQDFRLIPNLTVYDNIAFTLRVVGRRRKEIARRVERAMELVGLTHKAKVYPDQLSGGEQQRVAIARGIAHRPTLLFADEPTAELDTATAIAVVDIFKRLIADNGMTVLMTTHDPHMLEVADKVYTLSDGVIINGDD